jgi:hypothetical protein
MSISSASVRECRNIIYKTDPHNFYKSTLLQPKIMKKASYYCAASSGSGVDEQEAKRVALNKTKRIWCTIY